MSCRLAVPLHPVEAELGGDPEVAEAVLGDGADEVVAEALLIPRVVPEVGEHAGVPVEEIQTSLGAHPEAAPAVLENRLDVAVTKAGRVLGIGQVAGEGAGGPVGPVEPDPAPHPQVASAVFEELLGVGVAQGARILGIGGEADERVHLPHVAAQACRGADPERSATVFQQVPDIGAGDAARIVLVWRVDLELVAVITVQSVGRADPDEPSAVLDESLDRAVREALIGGEVPEFQTRPRQRIAGSRQVGERGDDRPEPERCAPTLLC